MAKTIAQPERTNPERGRIERTQRCRDELRGLTAERASLTERLKRAKQAPEQPYTVPDTSGFAPRGSLLLSSETVRDYAVRTTSDRVATVTAAIGRLEQELRDLERRAS